MAGMLLLVVVELVVEELRVPRLEELVLLLSEVDVEDRPFMDKVGL